MISKLNLAAPFLTHVRHAIDRSPELQAVMKKVNKLLKDYAEKKRGLSLGTLTILDVCDNKGELHHELIDFIKQLPNKKHYKQSQTSNIRRLVRAVINNDQMLSDLESDCAWGKGLIVSNLPTFMRAAWPLLPKAKEAGGILISIRAAGMDEYQRLSLPMSKWSERILKAMIGVAEEEGVDTLDALLVDHHADVLMKMMRDLHPRQELLAKRYLKRLSTKLGCQMPKPETHSVSLDELPDKLKGEVRFFQEWAPHGIESMPHLDKLAAEFDVKNKPLKPGTIGNYVRAICNGFGLIDWSGDIGVEDLLQLQPITRAINGRTYEGYFNPYVEQFRERERNRVSTHKRKGKDSVMFAHFFDALCTVAAFNGIFEMQTLFKQTYRPKLDKKTRKEIKKKKKKVFDRPWLDEQIRLLGDEVGLIISDKLYVLMPEERDTKETMENLRKCMFYVIIVTLRYTAFRQQCMRNCVFGENIIFNADGSVTFRYPERAIKNAMEIDTTYSYADHGETHSILIDALRGHREVYEYIAEIFGGGMEGQFFGRVLKDTIKCYKNARQFTVDFKNRGMQFLDFKGRLLKVDFKLHPHFLRGFAIDWMYQKLGMSKEDIAKVVGCTVKVIEREYMGEERDVDSGKLLAEVNKKIRKAKQEETEAHTQGQSGTNIHGLVRQLDASRGEIARERERARRAEERIKVLESELLGKEEGVVSSVR